MREQTLARQKQLGIVPADTELPPINPIGTPETRTGPDGLAFPALDYTRPWNELGEDEKQLFSRMAEVYAGFLAHADHHIGRLLDYLEQSGQLENTLVVVVSDNGASGEGGPTGSVNEMKFANGVADDLAENIAKLDELGGTKTYNHYPNGWAMAFNTPFKMWKRYEFMGEPPTRAFSRGRRERRAAKSATSTSTPSTSRRRSWTCSASSPPRRSRATPRRPSTGSACATASRTQALRRRGRRSSMPCSARARSGTRAGRP
jgi:arylsulfatase A-like enzyme